MAYDLPTLQEFIDTNLENIENRLNQTTPPVQRAFNRVIAIVLALAQKGLYLFAADRAKQCLAISADEDGLTDLGDEFDTPRKLAEATILIITLPGTNGTIIPASVSFIGDSNGVRYFPDASATISGGVATITVTAEDVGVVGNLNDGETLQIDRQVAGAETTATVQSTDNTGADQEGIEPWRARILTAERAANGGSNNTDNKIWAEAVAGVARAFPYSGQPFTTPPPTSFPGDRTVYILAETSIDADGVPPSSLLDEVREAINTDPVTGKTRNVLGIIDYTLYVEPINRNSFDVSIDGLSVDAGNETDAKADIDQALTAYFVEIFNFIEGLDVIQDRNDTITKLTVGSVVQDVLESWGASADDVFVKLSGGSFFQSLLLTPGELAKLGIISYLSEGIPSSSPSDSPSSSPSVSPSESPSASPSASVSPSNSPSESPSDSPSLSPSASPSSSVSPSNSPSESPSNSPSTSPSASPSASVSPSESPSESPSNSPSESPSDSPSLSPSASPSSSVSPSESPSESPSISPSVSPSASPSP